MVKLQDCDGDNSNLNSNLPRNLLENHCHRNNHLVRTLLLNPDYNHLMVLVRCWAGGNGGGNVVDTLENMANFVVDNNGDYKDPPTHDGGLHNGLQRGLAPRVHDPHG